MNDLISKVDLTYLPVCKEGETFLDAVDLSELNKAYDFACMYKARAFCTYDFLLPYIEHETKHVAICSVIDFPDGTSEPEKKVFQAGQAYEASKKFISSEIDVVLNPSSVEAACNDLYALMTAGVNEKIGVKLIIELGVRSSGDIKEILKCFNPEYSKPAFVCKYIKTNTGRKNNPKFEDKLEQVKWLRNNTELPLKISGGISSWEEIEKYEKAIRGKKIYGVGYQKLKEWK